MRESMTVLDVVVAAVSDARDDDPGASWAARRPQSTESIGRGRGVLQGAFAVLEALALAENGLGLTALARACGLAKTSTYRLAEQLADLGAVQRVEQRYYVGPRLGRIGQQFQPDPRLCHASQMPVRALATQSGCDMTGFFVLGGNRVQVISAAVRRDRHGCGDVLDVEWVARTVAGRVLCRARPTDTALAEHWTRREWRQASNDGRGPHSAAAAHHHRPAPGIYCVSAPVWYPTGACAGAVTALMHSSVMPPSLLDMVDRTARRIDARLR